MDGPRAAESDSGADRSPGNACTACGARNNAGQSHCWQCRAPLSGSRDRGGLAAPGVAARRTDRFLHFAALATVLLALVLTAHLLRQAMGTDPVPPARSLADVFKRDMAATRAVTCLLLVIGWPLLLHLTAFTLNITFSRPNRFLTLSGIILGALAYGLSFLPWPFITGAFLVPAVLSLLLMRTVLGLRWKQVVPFWVLQGAGAAALAAAAIWGMESLAAGAPLNPAVEFPPIYAIARRPPLPVQQVWPGPRETSFPPLSWAPTGSRWLDHRANRVRVEVHNQERSGSWTVTLRVDQAEHDTLGRRDPGDPAHVVEFVAQPRAQHFITIEPGGFQSGDAARVWSLLPLEPP